MRRLGLLFTIALTLGLCACATNARLPLRAVTLSGNGLGYFERSGAFSGDTLRLRLRAHEVDDILKTLVVLSDDGEKIGAVASFRSEKDGGTLELKLPSKKSRMLRIGYAAPTPAWTPIYRVVLGEPGAGRLQGWVLVQNPTEEDWRGKIVLATGAPFSIAVDLHSPRFIARPDATGKLVTPTLTDTVAAEGARADGDRDGDGIPDSADKCPEEPENYNGYEDEDGCPDKGRVVLSRGQLEVLVDKIYFDTNSAAIKAVSGPIIDAIAATLKGNPQIEPIEVIGHAASNERDPVALSLRRATALMQALVERGVDRARLRVEARGAGAGGSSENQWSLQRRVEFMIAPRTDQQDRPGELASIRQYQAVAPSAVKIEAGAGVVRYTLDASVVVPKRASSLVAIWNEPVRADEIYLYRPTHAVPGSENAPLRAVHLVGLPSTTLEPGPIALYVRGAFVGDALLDRLHAGETTIVPFALDTSTTVRHEDSRVDEPVRVRAIHHGHANIQERSVRRTRYEIEAGADAPSKIYVAHRRSQRYTPRDLPPGAETTAQTVLVPAALHANEKLTVNVEEEGEIEDHDLGLEDDAARALPFLANTEAPAAIRQAIESLAKREAAYDKLQAETQRAIDRFSTAAQRRSELDEDLKSLRSAHASPAQVAAAAKRLAEAVKASNAAATRAGELTTKAEAEHDAIQQLVDGLSFGEPDPHDHE